MLIFSFLKHLKLGLKTDRNECYGKNLVFLDDSELIQKLKIVEFKFRFPDQQNQITKENRELFDISNKFLKCVNYQMNMRLCH